MRKRVCGLLVAMMVLACVGMLAGCSDDVSSEDGRSFGKLVAIVDSSRAMMQNSHVFSECKNVSTMAGSYDQCESYEKNTGLFLVNYRNQENAIWGDTIDYTVKVVKGFYKDWTMQEFNKRVA